MAYYKLTGDMIMKGFNDIDIKKPSEGEAVIGYCEPMYTGDFEAELVYTNGEFYRHGRTVRCYYWKAI